MTDKKDEKYFDQALEQALNDMEEFAEWFLGKTKFKGMDARVRWSRSDHPWARLTNSYTNPETKVEETITRDSETDVLVIFESTTGKRVGIHIENKLGDRKFEPYQPESYQLRAKHWLNNPTYGNYSDFDTVIVAPNIFFERNGEQVKLFGASISYEEISTYLPEFSEAVRLL